MQENSFISNFKAALEMILFLICMVIIYDFLSVQYQKGKEHNVINYFTKARFDDFYALEENTLDMVFVGSSHSYCSFDPENFDSVLNITSHQMGTPLQHPDTTYYELLEIYRTQTPRVVVMELYWDVLDDDFEMKQANSFFEALQNEQLVQEYRKNVFPISEKVKYALLPIRYQQDYFAWEGNEIAKELENKLGVWKEKTEQPIGKEEYRSKGYVYCDYILPESEYKETNQFRGFNGKDFQLSRVQKNYLEKIIALCRQKGSELVFVTAPIANVSMEYISNYDKVHHSVSEFAKEHKIPYLDYNIVNQESKLFENENFRDDAHLNDSGVKILDAHFLLWLQENTNFLARIDEQ